jgi:hypothetical protein
MTQWWSWLLTAVGVTGLYYAGSKRKLGWAIGLAAQVLWITYAVTTRQWGFVASAFAYGWVYGRNWQRWHRESRCNWQWERLHVGSGVAWYCNAPADHQGDHGPYRSHR